MNGPHDEETSISSEADPKAQVTPHPHHAWRTEAIRCLHGSHSPVLTVSQSAQQPYIRDMLCCKSVVCRQLRSRPAHRAAAHEAHHAARAVPSLHRGFNIFPCHGVGWSGSASPCQQARCSVSVGPSSRPRSSGGERRSFMLSWLPWYGRGGGSKVQRESNVMSAGL